MDIKPLQNIGFQLVEDVNLGNKNKKTFYCIKKHGLLTWLEESTSNKPYFLKLYSPLTFKAKLYTIIIKVIWHLRLQSFFFEKISLSITEKSFVQTIFQQNIQVFSLFTGTVGDNRKVVVYCEFDNKKVFFKLPVGKGSYKNIANEMISLKFLAVNSVSSVKYPNLLLNSDDFIAIDDCEPHKGYNNIDELAINFHNELALKTNKVELLGDVFDSLELGSHNVESVKNQKLKRKLDALHQKCLNYVSAADIKSNVRMCYAHGDFTPWNCFLSRDNKLAVIDWELAGFYTPYFDLIHFTVFSSVLVDKIGVNEIKNKLNELNINFIKVNMELWETYISLYSLTVSAYYIKKFTIQDESIHEQAYWLIDSWTGLINE